MEGGCRQLFGGHKKNSRRLADMFSQDFTSSTVWRKIPARIADTFPRDFTPSVEENLANFMSCFMYKNFFSKFDKIFHGATLLWTKKIAIKTVFLRIKNFLSPNFSSMLFCLITVLTLKLVCPSQTNLTNHVQCLGVEIFRDYPAIVAPSLISAPVCLGRKTFKNYPAK